MTTIGVSAPDQWPRHASGTTFALAADVIALDDLDPDPRRLHAALGFGIALNHHGVAWPQGQNVAAHGVEFFRRHFHKLDATRFEELDLAGGHERRINDG